MRPGTVRVGIVDYSAGNIQSIENAFDHIGARTQRVRQESDLEALTHVLLPGVGAFGFCVDKLRDTGLIPALERWALTEGRPLLGICVGMQLMADRGEELGVHEGLGWVGGVVRELRADPPCIRVPHVGWNDVRFTEEFGPFAAGASADFYFDHSYALTAPTQGVALGLCDHGQEFTAAVRRGNLVAAQFHPEKSQSAGQRFLQGFLELSA